MWDWDNVTGDESRLISFIHVTAASQLPTCCTPSLALAGSLASGKTGDVSPLEPMYPWINTHCKAGIAF